MNPHNWVAMMVVPVHAEAVSAHRIDVSHTELAEELAKEDAVVACWVCDAVLSDSTVDTECPGEA